MQATRNPPKGLLPRIKHVAIKHKGPLTALIVVVLLMIAGAMDYDDQMQQDAYSCSMVADKLWPQASINSDCHAFLAGKE